MRGQYVNILTARFYQSYISGDVISGIIKHVIIERAERNLYLCFDDT